MFQNVTKIQLGLLVIVACCFCSQVHAQTEDADPGPIDTTALETKTIRYVDFAGKFKLRRYILYREIDSKAGHPLNLALLERDRRKVDGFGIFSRVDTYVIPDGDSVDIEFDLREVWTLLPMVALGRTDGKLDWSVGVHERNLLGFYLQVVVLYRRYEERNSGHLSATFPRFLGKDIALGFTIAQQREIDPLQFHGVRYDYDYLRKAISFSLGHRLREKLYVQGYVGYDREHWQLLADDTLGLAVKTIDYPRYVVGAGAVVGRVYYDRYFYIGEDISSDLSLIKERDATNFNEWRYALTGRKFIIKEPFNFAFRARFLTSSGDERVQPYAISGESNVRGQREKEERGDHALIANFETRWRTLNTRIFYGQLVAFADYGSIWGRGKSAGDGLKDPYYSLGVGIRGSIKQFLGRVGRIDLALNPRDGTVAFYLATSQFF